MLLTHLIFFRFFTGARGADAITPPAPAPAAAASPGGAGTTQRFGAKPENRRELRAKQEAPRRADSRPSAIPDEELPQNLPVVKESVDRGTEQARQIAVRAAEIARVKALMRIEKDREAIKVLKDEIKAIEESIRRVRESEEDEIILLLLQ